MMILLLQYSFYVVEPKFSPFYKWQYRAGAEVGAGARASAGAKIREKVESEPELEPKLNNFGFATLINQHVPTTPGYSVSESEDPRWTGSQRILHGRL